MSCTELISLSMNPFHHQNTYTMIIYTHPVANNLPIKTLVAKRLQILNHTIQYVYQTKWMSIRCAKQSVGGHGTLAKFPQSLYSTIKPAGTLYVTITKLWPPKLAVNKSATRSHTRTTSKFTLAVRQNTKPQQHAHYTSRWAPSLT